MSEENARPSVIFKLEKVSEGTVVLSVGGTTPDGTKISSESGHHGFPDAVRYLIASAFGVACGTLGWSPDECAEKGRDLILLMDREFVPKAVA